MILHERPRFILYRKIFHQYVGLFSVEQQTEAWKPYTNARVLNKPLCLSSYRWLTGQAKYIDDHNAQRNNTHLGGSLELSYSLLQQRCVQVPQGFAAF